MYEDVVSALRNLAEIYSITENTNMMEYQLSIIAADVIEELSKARDAACWGCKCEKIEPSGWIPVTERLPEEPYGCLAVVWDNPRYGGGDVFLNYYPEFIGWDGETWNDSDGEEIPLDVVYWMRLPQIPEPPEEET